MGKKNRKQKILDWLIIERILKPYKHLLDFLDTKIIREQK